MFEKNKDDFRDLGEKLRELDDAENRDQDLKIIKEKREIEYEILLKCNQYLNKQVKQFYLFKNQKTFMIEMGINAKCFCNHFKDFYMAGETGQAFKLIRYKHMTTQISA